MLGALFLATVTAHGLPLKEPGCKYLARSGDRMVMHKDRDLVVLPLSESDAAFEAELPKDAKVMCLRTGIVPAPGDWKVLAAGYTFYIAEDIAQGRTGVLDMAGGRFRFRLLKGELSAQEADLLEARLAAFAARMEG